MARDRGRTPRRSEDDLLDWFTVSYRSIYIGGGLLVVLLAGGSYFYFLRGPAASAPADVSAPAAPSQPTARFTALEGSVKVKPVGSLEWVNASRDSALHKSDLVRTASGAAAEIEFFDGTRVHVRPDSLITIEEAAEDPATRQRRVAAHIASGEVNFQTFKQAVPGGRTEVSTPTLKSTVEENSAGAVRVATEGDSDFRLYRGAAGMRTKTGDKVELATNQAVKVDAAGRAGPKQALPDRPLILAPHDQAELPYPEPSRAVTLLAWKAVAGAAGYHLTLDLSPHFNQPLVERRATKEVSQEVRGLDVGKYYWRVAAVSPQGLEGEAAASLFSVTRAAQVAAPPPPLSLDTFEVRDNILQIKGRTEAGANVTVNGQRIDVASDGSFNEFITLQKTGQQTVTLRATGINGGVAEQKRTVVVGQ